MMILEFEVSEFLPGNECGSRLGGYLLFDGTSGEEAVDVDLLLLTISPDPTSLHNYQFVRVLPAS